MSSDSECDRVNFDKENASKAEKRKRVRFSTEEAECDSSMNSPLVKKIKICKESPNKITYKNVLNGI